MKTYQLKSYAKQTHKSFHSRKYVMPKSILKIGIMTLTRWNCLIHIPIQQIHKRPHLHDVIINHPNMAMIHRHCHFTIARCCCCCWWRWWCHLELKLAWSSHNLTLTIISIPYFQSSTNALQIMVNKPRKIIQIIQ
ncbi:agamous MADS-box protein AGL80 [Trifolium repens]|nr:agamous MADS-box protein AGL80 [Trifolium repens]